MIYKIIRFQEDKEMILWDTHMHTHHSGDSDASPEEMIEQAKKAGLSGICFTDHYDYDYPEDKDLFLIDFDAYHKEMTALKEKYQGDFQVNYGIELGLQPHVAAHNKQLLEENRFDFVIGSSHVVHGQDPYYPSYYEGREESEAYLEYFLSIAENLKYDLDFDVYGHLDYVVRYGPTQNLHYSYEAYADVIDSILRTLIEKGKGIEVNTGGFRHGLGHPNPTEAILSRYRTLGGEIITIGADAHKPKDIAYGFDKVPELLRRVGFRYYTVFHNRKPRFYPL